MDAPKISNERMLELFKAKDRWDEQNGNVGPHGAAVAFKPEPRVRKNHMSIRLDRDGKQRWFHATKGWRGLVFA
ncbi:hypothetical protein [Bradyrhizobium sp. WSM1253]|uniref:hypothetical protein n=1 Tax=Bradyrhizobium sp. WSM1253 TaxID=319003 RepID=UPI00025D3045|nr:hypothetical protein [Bradyrhizobium sp. WSM1253]EIG62809.1 hypothetical protein Bra1253DRAFT_07745 [Bradyrhizobium sp. WSM1253]